MTDGDLEYAYARHYRAVYRYAIALTRSHDDAEEIAAEVFARAVAAWATSFPTPARQLPWLLLTARRLITDRWRRNQRSVRARAAVPGEDEPHQRSEFWIWYDALATVLSDRQREAMILRYQRDLSVEDIAAIMGLSTSGVRSLISRALDALRAHPELL
jgi:RNA polymerase sigma-70 factor, ECF subfamily